MAKYGAAKLRLTIKNVLHFCNRIIETKSVNRLFCGLTYNGYMNESHCANMQCNNNSNVVSSMTVKGE